MGDRSQIAVKQPTAADPDAKVYLYGHWVGEEIYPLLQKVIKADQRLDDPTYLTRIIAREMGMGSQGEGGYGIGNSAQGDIEHVIPILDCELQTVTFEQPDWEHNKEPAADGLTLTFNEFAAKPAAFFKGW